MIAGCANDTKNKGANRPPDKEQYLQEVESYRLYLEYPIWQRINEYDPCREWSGEYHDQCWLAVKRANPTPGSDE